MFFLPLLALAASAKAQVTATCMSPLFFTINRANKQSLMEPPTLPSPTSTQ